MQTLNAIINGELDGFVSSVSKSRPKVGITGSIIPQGEKFTLGGVEYTAPTEGFIVTAVTQNSGAYGVIEVGDIICGINGKTVATMEDLQNELYRCYVGQTVTFEIWRKNQNITVQITLGVS